MICVRAKKDEFLYIISDSEGVGYAEFKTFADAFECIKKNFNELDDPAIIVYEVFEVFDNEADQKTEKAGNENR